MRAGMGKYRGMRTNGKGWAYGSFTIFEYAEGHKDYGTTDYEIMERDGTYHEVDPETVGELVFTNEFGEHYEGDLYEEEGAKYKLAYCEKANVWEMICVLSLDDVFDSDHLNAWVKSVMKPCGTIHDKAD